MTVPGWYDDPQQPGSMRYWDGRAWTQHTQHRPVAIAAPTASPAHGFAVAALVLGLVGAISGVVAWLFWLAWLLGLLAIVFGVLGRRRPMALAGIALGVVALALGAWGLDRVDTAVAGFDRSLRCLDEAGPGC